MASIKDLKKRITSTKTTQQTTKAMKMVSAAKLRRATDAITNQRPYATRMRTLIQALVTVPDAALNSPFFKKEIAEGRGKRLLLVLVTSDRGLCGGFNGNIIKAAQRWVASHQAEYASIELAFVGKRGYDFFKTKKYQIGTFFSDAGGKVTYAKARKLGDALTQSYLTEQVDEVKVIFNEFKNAVTQIVQVENFLPIQASESVEATESVNYIVKPSPRELLDELLSKYFGIQAFRVLLESQASEHGARMAAMENATKNAEEMVRSLTLDYNKQRQAGITKELLEIIAGSESQKVS